MGIDNINQKIVDSVYAAYAITNSKLKIRGSLEYPWYLTYNLLLNNLFSGSKHLVVSAQHWIQYDTGKKKKDRPVMRTLIPDYVLMYMSSTGSKANFQIISRIIAVVEIKALSKEISKAVEEGNFGKGIRKIEPSFKLAEDQAERQAQVALFGSGSEAAVIFSIVGVGPYWTYQVFHWDGREKTEEEWPVLSPEYNEETDHPICKLIDTQNSHKISKKSEDLLKKFQYDINRYFGQLGL